MKTYSRNIDSKDVSRVKVIQAETSPETFIEFYPAIFNQKSKLIREYGETFYEIIDPKAFDNVLKDPGLNTIHTVDHVRLKMLGRVISGTLKLETDEYGLKATLNVPDTTLGRDMLVMIERGDYFECSFIYTIAERGVMYDRSQDIPVRTILNIQDLFDTSFVIDGAFANTTIKRELSNGFETPEYISEIEFQEQQKREFEIQSDILGKRIQILKHS